MRFAKVPFGLHRGEKSLKDVREVPGGLKCGCICPSCELPLSAKKCTDKIDHFAHHTGSGDKKVEVECDYSYWVAVAQMARQLFFEADQFEMDLPEYSIEKPGLWPKLKSETLPCSSRQTVTLTNIRVKQSIDAFTFDVVGHIKGHEFAIRFVHPDSSNVPDLSCWYPSTHRLGVLLIQLNGVMALFKAQKGHLKEALAEYLRSNLTCKAWHYHPTMQRKLIDYNQRSIEAHKAEHASKRRKVVYVEPCASVKAERPKPRRSGPRPTMDTHADRFTKLFRNARGCYLFYCWDCDLDARLNGSSLECQVCGKPMHRLTEEQAHERLRRR